MTKSHYLDVFDTHIHLVTTKTEWAALRRRVTTMSPVSEMGTMGTAELTAKGKKGSLKSGHLIIHINVEGHLGDKGSLLDTVAHESYHGAALIFDQMGAEYDGKNEPIAYLLGWIARWVWENLC